MNELRMAILQTIQKCDGQYGWYQLDRAVSTSGVVISENLLGVLRGLEGEGFIQSASEGKSKDPKYSITSKGRAAIEYAHWTSQDS
jgi:DNA-binding PadR family transcriptional regulator